MFPFIPQSALTTALLASLTLSCIILQVQTSQPHLQVHAHPYSGSFLLPLNLALAFTLQHLNPLSPSPTLTSVSSSYHHPLPCKGWSTELLDSAIVTSSDNGSFTHPCIFNAERPCFKALFLTVCHPLLIHIQLCKSNSSHLWAEAGAPHSQAGFCSSLLFP